MAKTVKVSGLPGWSWILVAVGVAVLQDVLKDETESILKRNGSGRSS